MAAITIRNVRQSYVARPVSDADYALKRVSLDFADGGAYALLGPSGCGKTTLLNLVSGLLAPTDGQILFDGVDMTHATPEARNIAQVFQFPVIYDTMTVYDNLAFPLRNRHIEASLVDARVRDIARMLDLSHMLDTRASGLTADGKQKISLGRGLVRSDVAVIMFDEPLTVIDPHLKWQLRSKLKEMHATTGRTMIYVTHDQTEALTFADQVVVMNMGIVVQTGTPIELYERPRHTFVGHFIGSPGMNILPCTMRGQDVLVEGHVLKTENGALVKPGAAGLELGIRPEFIRFADRGLPVQVVKVADGGRVRIVETRAGAHTIKLVAGEDAPIPEGAAHLAFDAAHSFVYEQGWIAGERTHG